MFDNAITILKQNDSIESSLIQLLKKTRFKTSFNISNLFIKCAKSFPSSLLKYLLHKIEDMFKMGKSVF